MQCTVKTVVGAVPHMTNHRITVTKIVGAAKHHHDVGICFHFGHTGTKILVVVIFGEMALLFGNFGAHHAVAIHLAPSLSNRFQ